MKTIALALCLLAACAVEPAAPLPEQHMVGVAITTDVETNIPADSQAAFSRYIQKQIGVWNDGLEARGCEAPFAWATDLAHAHMTVKLAADVTSTRFPPNGGGYFDGRDVWLQADTEGSYDQAIRLAWPAIAQHELGHALGLPHNSRDDSVMGPAFSLVTEIDFEDAARAIGCE